MQIIGRCYFTELPAQYQSAFEEGSIASAEGEFYPFQATGSAVPLAIFGGLIYFLPAVAVLVGGPLALLLNPDLVGRIWADMRSGVGPLLVLLAIFGVLLSVSLFMLLEGLRAVVDARTWFRIKRAPKDRFHYGLLLAEKELVVRHGDHFDGMTSVFLPRKVITDCFAIRQRMEGAKRPYYLDVVKIRFVTPDGFADELMLRERFSLSADKMAARITHWL